jgi:hypothetical protein
MFGSGAAKLNPAGLSMASPEIPDGGTLLLILTIFLALIASALSISFDSPL